jgi:K+-transporting ATPase KdpF subunit
VAVLAAMSGADVFGLVVSVIVFVYLLYALVRGERF